MDRKKFILSSSFFLVGMNFLKASTLIPSNNFQVSTKGNLSVSLLLKKAADLRKSNFVKRQNQGTMSRRMFFSSPTTNPTTIYSIYDEILLSNPSEIRAYNGKRKFMIQESESLLDIVSMYLNGMEVNPQNALFKERTAKEYLRVLTGSKKQIKKLPYPLNDKTHLLKAIEDYYEQAIKLDDSNEQFIVQLTKLKELKSIGFFDIDSRINTQLKSRRKNQKSRERQEKEALTSVDYAKKIKRLKSRVQEDKRDTELVNSEKHYIRKLQKEGAYNLAVEQSVKYFNRNPQDVDGLKLVRIVLSKNKRYDLLEIIERENNKSKNTYWSNLSLSSVLLKRVEIDKKNNFREISNILSQAKKLAMYGNEGYEVRYREIYLKVLSKNKDVEKELLEFGSELQGIRFAYRIDRYTRLCALYYMSEGNLEKALLAIDVVLIKGKELFDDDNVLEQLKTIGEFRYITSLQQNEELELLREKILNA